MDNNFCILPLPGVTNKSKKISNDKSLHELKRTAHDLNNILNNISIGIELAKDQIEDKLSLRNLLENIQNNSKKANNIINQILATEKEVYKKNKISLDAVIDETIISVKDSLPKNIIIEYSNNAGNDKVYGNRTDIYRALLNLIINASEAISKEGKISISVRNWYDTSIQPINRRYEEYVIVEVKDTGNGINSEDIKKIFTEGFSTKNANRERGLGLSIVKEIIEKHSGFIRVKSKKQQGTIFKLYIPNYKQKEKISFNNETVIIAEDDYFQREVLRDLLTSLNLKVLSASNGIDVLNFYNREKVDLIFIDKNMPEMNGIECIKEIRRTNKQIPIILSTGSTNDSEIAANTNQISKLLLKPYNFEMIQNYLQELLV